METHLTFAEHPFMTLQANHRGSLCSWSRSAWLAVLTVCVVTASSRVSRAGEGAVQTAPAAVTLEQVQDVLARAGALARRLETPANCPRLRPLVARVQELERSVAAPQPGPAFPAAQLPGVYAEAQSLARQIAFCNPRLDF